LRCYNATLFRSAFGSLCSSTILFVPALLSSAPPSAFASGSASHIPAETSPRFFSSTSDMHFLWCDPAGNFRSGGGSLLQGALNNEQHNQTFRLALPQVRVFFFASHSSVLRISKHLRSRHFHTCPFSVSLPTFRLSFKTTPNLHPERSP